MVKTEIEYTLPLWRDWTAWLFLLLATFAISAVLYASGPDDAGTPIGSRGKPVAPPPDVIPEVLPMELAPLAEDDARAENMKIPFVTHGFVAARSFIYSGDIENRARARDCLAAAMLYEAGNDYLGQRAVGQVVINRVRHPAFPKSICGVVFQGSERKTGCQFTFTCDGALQRRYSEAAWIGAQVNAEMILGGSVDPRVGLATHYHTDWVRPYWSDSLEKIAAVDTHLFFRWPGYWGTPGAFRGAVSGIEAPVAKLAGLSPMHLAGIPAELVEIDPAAGEPRITNNNGVPGEIASGGRETITILLDRKATPESFVTLALRLCGAREFCKFLGWSNPMLKPESEAMNDMQRAGMTFSYLRDDKAGFEKALWNCSEYKRDDERQCMKR